MQFFVTRTGLDAFDVARAWGLAVLLNALTEEEVKLQDVGWAFIVEPISCVSETASVGGMAWRTLFSAPDVQWEQVFMTLQKKREKLLAEEVSDVRKIIENSWQKLFGELQNPTNFVVFGEGETLPGGLEPSAFKGLRHSTKSRYSEENLKVQEEHWALACLGMATCGTYKVGEGEWLVLLPIPQELRFNYFRDVRELMRPSLVNYRGVQNAAAHYAVQLAEQLRSRAEAQGSLQDRFSSVLYFTLFRAGKQTKPSQGSKLNLAPLMDLIQKDPRGSEVLFLWLDSCFRLGAKNEAEDLALAATELVMRWDLDAFYRLVRVLVRLLGREQVQRKYSKDFKKVLWRTEHQTIQKAMEVIRA